VSRFPKSPVREICTPGSVGVGSPKVTLLPGVIGKVLSLWIVTRWSPTLLHVRFGGEYTKTCHYWVRRCVLSLRKPVNNVLESTCDVALGNARHIKNLPGRKTDINDARWIAELHRSGLIRKSFVAPQAIRELRDLTRYRKKLKGAETSERNRIHKILEDANIKISTYMTDVFGVSGRLMLGQSYH